MSFFCFFILESAEQNEIIRQFLSDDGREARQKFIELDVEALFPRRSAEQSEKLDNPRIRYILSSNPQEVLDFVIAEKLEKVLLAVDLDDTVTHCTHSFLNATVRQQRHELLKLIFNGEQNMSEKAYFEFLRIRYKLQELTDEKWPSVLRSLREEGVHICAVTDFRTFRPELMDIRLKSLAGLGLKFCDKPVFQEVLSGNEEYREKKPKYEKGVFFTDGIPKDEIIKKILRKAGYKCLIYVDDRDENCDRILLKLSEMVDMDRIFIMGYPRYVSPHHPTSWTRSFGNLESSNLFSPKSRLTLLQVNIFAFQLFILKYCERWEEISDHDPILTLFSKLGFIDELKTYVDSAILGQPILSAIMRIRVYCRRFRDRREKLLEANENSQRAFLRKIVDTSSSEILGDESSYDLIQVEELFCSIFRSERRMMFFPDHPEIPAVTLSA